MLIIVIVVEQVSPRRFLHSFITILISKTLAGFLMLPNSYTDNNTVVFDNYAFGIPLQIIITCLKA